MSSATEFRAVVRRWFSPQTAAWLLGLGVLAHALHALFGFGGHRLDGFYKNDVYTAVEVLAVAVSGARVVLVRQERWAWGLMTFALAVWTGGDLVWTVWLNNLANPPYPSVADALYLAMYPAMYVGLMLLLRSRIRDAETAQWLDGAVVALAMAAVGAGLILPTVLANGQGRAIEDVVNLAYPLADLTLLAFVAVAFSLANWRPGRMWLLLGAGIALDGIGDLVFAYQAAKGTYVAGGILDTAWPAALSLSALAAWQPATRRSQRAPSLGPIVLPLTAAAAALGLLIVAAFRHVTPVAVGLAGAALVVAAVRASFTYLQNVRILRQTELDAVTDGLSGLSNRRRLMQDVEAAARQADRAHPTTLAFFDLNGFKLYNDTFGHAAGDALLVRLGAALRASVEPAGRPYRLGGDEFCVLFTGRFTRDHPHILSAAGALSEAGSGFNVNPSYGVAIMPDEATTAAELLQLADQRMYTEKARVTRSGGVRTRDVLMALVNERAPALHNHIGGVEELVRPVAQALGLQGDQLDEVIRAAELHDVGKLAVPDRILNKSGTLSEPEWRFVRQHPIVGERILNVDPALRPVARLVRSTHERWEGGGYPDGLAGAAIPLGARIIAVCDAFEAMVRGRWYEQSRSRAEALAELRRAAGTQFDPEVVATFCALAEPPARSQSAPLAARF